MTAVRPTNHPGRMSPSLWNFVHFLVIFFFSVASVVSDLPCVYKGRLRTRKDWDGFLANLTIHGTGRMSYEFSYPADMCCQNVLFYREEQVAVLVARMNCWQREDLLNPEDDQILRLTPRFHWSGCLLQHPGGVARYQCEGGRSFTSETPNKPSHWYVAVSNCHNTRGIHLDYRITVHGHTGVCRGLRELPSPPPKAVLSTVIPEPKASTQSQSCVASGTINTTDSQWYGYIVKNLTLMDGGGFRFKFSFPIKYSPQKVVLYTDDNLKRFTEESTNGCWGRLSIINTIEVPNRILDLAADNSINSCIKVRTDKGPYLQCEGMRRFDIGLTLYVAVANCHHNTGGIYLEYHLDFFNFLGNPCGAACLRRSLLSVTGHLLVTHLLLSFR